MKQTVWTMTLGNGGYIPDSTSYYETLAEAVSAAKDEKSLQLDCENVVTGNIRKDFQYKVWQSAEAITDAHSMPYLITLAEIQISDFADKVFLQTWTRAEIVEALNDGLL